MKRLVLLVAVVGLGAIALFSCSSECSTANDCASGSVCYNEICTPANAQSLEGCICDEECNGRVCGEQPGSGEVDQLQCIADRCRLKPPRTIVPDAGAPD